MLPGFDLTRNFLQPYHPPINCDPNFYHLNVHLSLKTCWVRTVDLKTQSSYGLLLILLVPIQFPIQNSIKSIFTID